MTVTANYQTIQIKITKFNLDWDYNPWDMPPDYDLERGIRGDLFEVEIDPSLTEDENREFIVEQIIEKEDLMWDIEDIDWEVVTT